MATLTRETKTPELERVKLNADLAECLRTYDILGLWRDAEDVLRREVVRGFVKKVKRLIHFVDHSSIVNRRSILVH